MSQKQRLSRRDFLQSISIGSFGLFLPTFSKKPLFNYMPYSLKVTHSVSKRPLLLSPPQTPLSGLLARLFFGFMVDVGANVIANHVSDWIDDSFSSDSSQLDRVDRLNDAMAGAGFTVRDNSSVHDVSIENNNGSVTINNHNFSYCFENQSQTNACCAYINPYRSNLVAVVEGPVILGLAIAAQDWEDKSRLAARDITEKSGLVPLRQEVVQDGDAPLDESLEESHIYQTDAGEVEVGYDYYSSIDEGVLQVVSRDNDNRILFEEEYDVSMAT